MFYVRTRRECSIMFLLSKIFQIFLLFGAMTTTLLSLFQKVTLLYYPTFISPFLAFRYGRQVLLMRDVEAEHFEQDFHKE